MKKFISMLLIVCMIVTALPTVSSAVRYETYDTLFSAYATIGFSHTVTPKLSESLEKIGAYKYYHIEAEAGSYGNNDLIFTVKPLNIKPADYPYIKVCYRTDSPISYTDFSITSPKGENWLKTMPSTTSDGEWHTFTVDYRELNAAGTDKFPDQDETNVNFRIKPFGSGNITLDSEAYYDINYIAFFKTQAEADAFEYHRFSSSSYEHTILTPEAIYSYYGGVSTGIVSTTFRYVDYDNSYVRYLVAPGKYNNNECIITFSHDAFDPLDRPYVKVTYRTDAKPSGNAIDVSITSGKGENWLKTARPTIINDGSIASFTFSLNDMTGASNVSPVEKGDTVTYRLKPWGSGDKTITEDSYFDIMHIGFFATKEAAEHFVYEGDSAYSYDFTQNVIEPDYTYGDLATVRGYIDDADDRKDEIIHSNNTVPYEDHLTFSKLTGKYTATNDSSEYELTALAGSYGANEGIISFTQNDVAFSTYPKLRLSYRADFDADMLVTLRSSAGSAQKQYTITSSNDYNTLIVDLTDLENYQTLLGGSNISIEFAPFGTGSRNISSDMHLALQYIGIFRTRPHANSFKYNGENGANMTSGRVIYTADLLDPASTASGTKYFVSSSTGNDSNNGLTPQTAWKTLDRVVKEGSNIQGSTVFLKRGDSWRTTSSFGTQANTVYTSYGFGDKPAIIASIDGADASMWSKTEWENVWAFSQKIYYQANDIGHIRINDGELWGIKISAQNGVAARVNNGNVFNGRTYIESYDGSLEEGNGLINDLEFYHDYSHGTLYLYCADGNPGEVFDSIEIAKRGNAINGTLSGTTLDNIYVTGAGSHGIGYGNVENSYITNCRLEWIGGSIQALALSGTPATGSTPVRFGNAIESYGSAVNFTIANCLASQVYDCCFTVQNQDAVTFDGVFMYDNVAEYSNTGLEVWQNGGMTRNMYMHDNYTLYGGYGWSHQRPGKDGNFFYGGLGINKTDFYSNSIENNINVLASSIALNVSMIASVRYNFNHNVYIMAEGKSYSYAPINPESEGACGYIPFEYENLKKVTSAGTDMGSTFYFVPSDIFNIGDDPHDVFKTSSNPVYDITSSKDLVVLEVGDTYTMDITVSPADATNKDVYFSSSNSLIASVDQNGVVSAKYPGQATITALSVETGVAFRMKVEVITKLDPITLCSKDSISSATDVKLLFVGDSFLGGDNDAVSVLKNDYFISPEKKIADSMSFASTDDNVKDELYIADIRPELVVISAGYNDYKASCSLNTFKEAFAETIVKARELYPYARIAYVTPYNITSEANSAGLYLADYVNAACALAETYHVPTADMYHSAKTKFALVDITGKAGIVLTKYIDPQTRHTTADGAAAFAEDMFSLLANTSVINVQGKLDYKYFYNAKMLYKIASVQNSSFNSSLFGVGDTFYTRFTPRANGVADDGSSFEFTFNDDRFAIADLPYVKIYYRSNVADSDAKLDFNIGVYKDGVSTRAWSSTALDYDKSGSVSSLVIDLNTITGGDNGITSLSQADEGSPLLYLRLKPYFYEKTISSSDYFDILSIAFFATEEDAANDGITDDTAYALGDIDRDGNITAADSVLLSRYIALWSGYTIDDITLADVNIDGYVNSSDAVLLSRVIANWAGYSTNAQAQD